VSQNIMNGSYHLSFLLCREIIAWVVGWGKTAMRFKRDLIMPHVTQVKTQHLGEKTNLQAVLLSIYFFFVKSFWPFFWFSFLSLFFVFVFFLYSFWLSISNSYRRCQLTHSECHVTKDKLVLHPPPPADVAVAFSLSFFLLFYLLLFSLFPVPRWWN